MRLDAYLALYFPEKSRSMWQKYIKKGLVRINQQIIDKSDTLLGEDDEVTFAEPSVEIVKVELPIIFENDNVIVFDKPAGILSHAKGGICLEQTVSDAIKQHTSYAKGTNRAGIVHRLDRATSGVIVTVKNAETARFLQRQFTNRTVKKTYIALVEGIPKQATAEIDMPIQRNPKAPSQFRVNANGKSAQTFYKIIEMNHKRSLLELQPKTGRTHQLRVHLAYLGHPIIGDIVYGRPDDRMFLHAKSIELTLPDGERKVFTAPLPKIFKDALNRS